MSSEHIGNQFAPKGTGVMIISNIKGPTGKAPEPDVNAIVALGPVIDNIRLYKNTLAVVPLLDDTLAVPES
jgi:hypothetical protein